MTGSAGLGQHLEDYVAELVKQGRYGSRSEVLREGLKLLEERETRRAALDAALAEGLADVEAGRVRPIEEVHAELLAKFDRMAEERGL